MNKVRISTKKKKLFKNNLTEIVELKNITEILKGFKSRYDQAEDRLRKLEYQSCEIIK